MNPPQAVTIRYASNLLRDGHNDTYALESIKAIPNIINERPIGFYYEAIVTCPSSDFASYKGYGAAPLSALQHALELHGVTFR